ncbi:hypothetical protein MSG28_015004 [Choristoneura fumiferana]|uniref:Uncharacterized protein n=1 Tax=Choristoneura fumiferana TaxID=7141 RepID=A0ACC0KZ82_CHOFU|nr:hypothetical protein MSG28_015004 [Choristoneura fumiferana]
MMISMHKDNVRPPSDPRSDRRPGLSGAEGVKWVTGHQDASNQASYGKNATGNRNVNLRREHRIGTWNVRGLLGVGKLHILERELERCKLTITGISETHWKDSGHFDSGKHTFYFSGNDKSSFSGVAIAIPKSWKNSVLGYHPINDRIISIKLSASPTPLNVIQIYAPTSSAKDEEIEDFYCQLESSVANIPKRELVLIIGDFNAKVGNTTMDTGIRDIVGNYGHGVRNPRGERLIEFAADNNMAIMNTMFKHHPRRQYTWTSPDGNYRNQIDYILVRSRWRSSITNTHTMPGADCHSDHQLLIGNLRLKLQRPRQVKTSRRMEVKDPKSLATSIEGRHVAWRADYGSDSSNSMWIAAKKYIEDAVVESQPKSSVAKRQHWMTEDTWHLVEDRRKLKASGASITELNARSAIIQTACRRDRNNHLGKICDELEQHSDNYQTKDLHDKVRYITRQFKPKTWAIEDSVGTTVTEIKDIVNVWKEYCKSLFFSNGVPSFTCSPRQILDREPNIMQDEVRAAIKHLKCNKAMGCDEIPIEVFKAMGESGVDVLFTICNKIWETGIWPDDWSQSIFIPLHKKGSTKKCNNYRLISLISHASKVMLHIINTRLSAYLSRQIAPEQAGFVKGRGTREQILILRQIIEKAREFNSTLYICFVDFRKAFDTVIWAQLWRILAEMGVPPHLIVLLRRLYESGTAAVRTKEDMENLLTRLETTSLKFGLSINREKTKMMIVDRAEQIRTNVQSIANCEVVQSYIYLGSTISSTGGCSDEIRRRCAITRSAVERLRKIWRDRRVTKKTKVRLMKCLVFPIFLYGAETWSLRLQDRRKIDALEMWCWRRLLKIPWTAFRTNLSILKELHIKDRLSSTVQLRILKFLVTSPEMRIQWRDWWFRGRWKAGGTRPITNSLD